MEQGEGHHRGDRAQSSPRGRTLTRTVRGRVRGASITTANEQRRRGGEAGHGRAGEQQSTSTEKAVITRESATMKKKKKKKDDSGDGWRRGDTGDRRRSEKQGCEQHPTHSTEAGGRRSVREASSARTSTDQTGTVQMR